MKLVGFILIVALVGGISSGAATDGPLQLEELPSYTTLLRPATNLENSDITPQADLLDNIVPKSYTLSIRPILDPDEGTGAQWTAPGHVDIEIEPILSTDRIVLHRHRTLTIDEASVKVTGPNGVVSVANQTYEDPDNFHIISLRSSLVGGERYTVSIDFIAPVSATTAGLYRAEYTDDEGKEYRLATTQFESDRARQAFPCFDEPRWKTPFTISIGYKNETYNTLCNSEKKGAPVKDQNLEGWVWDHFETTVRMPTYLIAITISNFDFHEAPEPIFGDRPVRIYGEPRYIGIGGGAYAANASAHLLNFLETKYIFPYEMPKMDSVAIPNPFFGAGAMENWGLNIYREQYLLFFEGEQSAANKQQITSVLSHELAHQWFGNLVTCKTWDNLWLNEGFATYVANFGVQDTHAEFQELKGRLSGQVQNAMNSDVTGSRPIYGPGASSTITYDKGGSIIRMMEGFLGEDTLTKGIVNYLKALSYEAAVQDDLFEHLTAQAILDKKLPEGKTVKDIMDTWTLQAGFPLIRVRKFNAESVFITQERFQPSGTNASERYEVPIATATEDSALFSNHTPAIWLKKSETTTALAHNTSKMLVLNPDAMSYYRVLYDQDLTGLILSQLKIKREALSGLSRSQLIDDYFNFYKHGHVTIEQALDITTFLSNDEGVEDDFVVWFSLLNQLTKQLSMFQAHNGGSNHSMANYLRPTIEAALTKIGWVQQPTDAGTLVLYKAKLLDWACAFQSETCFSTAKGLMDSWRSFGTNPIAVDVQPVMYCAAAAVDGEDVVEFLVEQFAVAPSGTYRTHRSKLLNALSCTTDVLLLERLLEIATDSTSVIGKSIDDSYTVFQRVAGNPVGRPVLLKYLDENFDLVNAHFNENLNYVTNILSTLSSYYTRETDLNALESFISKHPVLQGSLNGALNTIRSNINWITDNYAPLDNWFKSH